MESLNSCPEQVDTSSPLTIGILGGGLGGMALAMACQKLGNGQLRATVFERDASFDARSQGYGLTVQQGMKVLHTLGIEMDGVGVSSSSHFSFLPDGECIGCYGRDLRLQGDGAEEAKSPRVENDREPLICWKCKGLGRRQASKRMKNPGLCSVCSGTGFLPLKPSCDYNVHLPRQTLRKMLMDGLAPGTVSWDHKFKQYEILEDGKVRVHFDGDKPPQTFDVAVGADGIHSAFRKQRLSRGDEIEDKLIALNIMVVLGITLVEHPVLSSRVFQTLDGETRLYVMPFDAAASPGAQQPTMWQLSFPIHDGVPPVALDPVSLKQEALRRCGSWHPPIPQLLTSTKPENITGYPAFDRDLVTPERLRQGGHGGGGAGAHVTLMGDAVHPMSPFKGQGANQALCDALDLAKALLSTKNARVCRNQNKNNGENTDLPLENQAANDGIATSMNDSIAAALAKYEAGMLIRSRNKVERSRIAARVLHTRAATVYACCVRAGAALGHEDPERQMERSIVCKEEATAMANKVRALLYST